MFSYTVKVNPLPRPLGKIVGFASLLIDDVLEVNGFRIINGQKGLFVSPPQHKGKGKDENGLKFGSGVNILWQIHLHEAAQPRIGPKCLGAKVSGSQSEYVLVQGCSFNIKMGG